MTLETRVIAVGALAQTVPVRSTAAIPGLRIYPGDSETLETESVAGLESQRIVRETVLAAAEGEVILPAVSLDWYDVVARSWQLATLPEQRVAVVAAGSAAEAASLASSVPTRVQGEAGVVGRILQLPVYLALAAAALIFAGGLLAGLTFAAVRAVQARQSPLADSPILGLAGSSTVPAGNPARVEKLLWQQLQTQLRPRPAQPGKSSTLVPNAATALAARQTVLCWLTALQRLQDASAVPDQSTKALTLTQAQASFPDIAGWLAALERRACTNPDTVVSPRAAGASPPHQGASVPWRRLRRLRRWRRQHRTEPPRYPHQAVRAGDNHYPGATAANAASSADTNQHLPGLYPTAEQLFQRESHRSH